jgi:hypothetical protein
VSKILASSVPEEPGKPTYFQHLKAEQSTEQGARYRHSDDKTALETKMLVVAPSIFVYTYWKERTKMAAYYLDNPGFFVANN